MNDLIITSFSYEVILASVFYFYLGFMVGCLANLAAKLNKREWGVCIFLWPLFLTLVVPLACAIDKAFDEYEPL